MNKAIEIARACIQLSKDYGGATAPLLRDAGAALESSLMREVALRAEVEELTKKLAALVKVADRLLTDLENVVEGLDPEEAAQVAEMRAIVDAAKSP